MRQVPRSLGMAAVAVFGVACGSARPPTAKTAPEVTPAAGDSPTAPTRAPDVDPVTPRAQALVASSTPSGLTGAADGAPAPPLPAVCAAAEPDAKKPLCTPDADFARRACAADFPEVALAFFAKGSPWSRAYLTRDVDAWNAGGGRTHRAKLAFDEEVVVLQHRKASPGGIVMLSAKGDTGSYDVLRWDGSCVSVMAEELTTNRPPAPKRAVVVWRHLDDPTRTALLGTPRIRSGYEALGKACDGTSEAKCSQAEASLSNAVVDFVRTGGALPAPVHRP